MRNHLRRLGTSFLVWAGVTGAAGTAAASTQKPYIAGLISMGDAHCLNQPSNSCQPDNAMADAFAKPGLVQAYVVNITWAQLQPNSSANFVSAAIDSALNTLGRYNAQYPTTPMRAVLRIESGSVAPGWVKNLAGGPVSVLLRSSGKAAAVPRFWTGAYQAAWRGLQAMLAGRYDQNPLVAEISNTSCSHQSDEPYVNPTDSGSIVAMFQAGYANSAYQACLQGAVHDYDAWKTTPVDFTQNPFETLSETTSAGHLVGVYGPLDQTFTTSVMQQFRAALGARAILTNHNLNDPIDSSNAGLYQAMAALGRPIGFQTAAPGVPGTSSGKLRNWSGTVATGLGYGASAIEIWPSKTKHGKPVQDGWNPANCAANVPSTECAGQSAANLQSWAAQLEAAMP